MRTGRTQKGRFDIHPGMCFTMHDMDDLASCGLEQMPGNHPWLVTSVDDDYVEIVMCSTLISDNEDKYRLYSLEYKNVTDISNGCPPMDEHRMSKASMDTFMLLPKKELFSHSLRLLNNNTANCNFTTHGMESLCLCETSLNGIRKDINQYLADHPEYDYDPFQCIASSDYMWQLENDEIMDVPAGFTKEVYEKVFGWENIKEADKQAVYPKETQLHPYEACNEYMVRLIRHRDNRKPRSSIRLTDADLAAVSADSQSMGK